MLFDLNSLVESLKINNTVMMQLNRSLLKKYSLFPDLTRLNHPDYYHQDFDTTEIIQHFAAISTAAQWKASKQSCQFYIKNLKSTLHKNVYVVLKWLITTHKIIQAADSTYLVEALSDGINQIGKIECEEHIEDYIETTLIKPYKQYLQKLCYMTIHRLAVACQTKKRPSFDKENNNNDISIHFFKLNLVRYALKEFLVPCKEILGFFSSAYPYLCHFSRLVGNDLKIILQQLGKQINRSFPGISRSQIQRLECQIIFFEDSRLPDSTYLQTPIRLNTITDFFNSHPRIDIQIQPFSEIN